MEWMWLILFSFSIGILVVSLGGGGGALYVALLPVLFAIPLKEATVISIITIIPTTLSGSYSHYRNGHVAFRRAWPMLIFAIGGCIVGALLSKYAAPALFKKLVGGVLVFFGLLMLRPRKKKDPEASAGTGRSRGLRFWFTSVFFGLLGGLMSGFLGLSGTAAILPGLMSLDLDAPTVIGTSVLLLCGISITSFLSHLFQGMSFDWPVILCLCGGAMVGGWLGPVLMRKVDKQVIVRVVFPIMSALIVISGIMMLLKK
jgi:uncharacterized membrane protein YfcA